MRTAAKIEVIPGEHPPFDPAAGPCAVAASTPAAPYRLGCGSRMRGVDSVGR
jgi:hypothetical protein